MRLPHPGIARGAAALSFVTAALVGCGGAASSSSSAAEPAAVEPSVVTAPAAPAGPSLFDQVVWIQGDWRRDGKAETEHWVAAGGVVFGVGLHAGGFEVLILDDGPDPANRALVLTAMPGGKASVDFALAKSAPSTAAFTNPMHDDPKVITYARQGDVLTAVLEGPSGAVAQTYRFQRFEGAPAPALEQADLDFAADTRKRGADGWAAAFDPEGGMWGAKRGRIAGPAAVREVMADTFRDMTIEWAPIASRLSPDGALGFTVGKADYRDRKSGEVVGHGRYVTIWRRQANGAWKVLFDTGRPADEP